MRIKGNSIRIRLTRSETDQIGKGLSVREEVQFGKNTSLHYILEPAKNLFSLDAKLEGTTVRILIPEDQAKAWARSKAVSIDHQLESQGGEPGLFLLVEKDFSCLKPRARQREDESDLFENPNQAHGSCG